MSRDKLGLRGYAVRSFYLLGKQNNNRGQEGTTVSDAFRYFLRGFNIISSLVMYMLNCAKQFQVHYQVGKSSQTFVLHDLYVDILHFIAPTSILGLTISILLRRKVTFG